MNVVYNSDHYHVVEYPAYTGIELINKDVGRTVFLHGDAATRFRDSMRVAAQNANNIEGVDAFLGGFDVLMTQSLVLH